MKRIHIKRCIGLLAVCLALVSLAGCLDDELGKTGQVKEGVPVTVHLNLATSALTDVTVTRASGSDLSELTDIIIFVFHEDGSFEQAVTNYQYGENTRTSLTIKDNKITTDGEHRYSVSFETTSGVKQLIALSDVANGAYWSLEDMIRKVYEERWSFDKLKAVIAEIAKRWIDESKSPDGMQPFQILAANQMFVTGWNENVKFTPNNKTDCGIYGIDSVAIRMYRTMASVNFEIAVAKQGEASGVFTPSSYRVFNIPTRSYLVNDLQGRGKYALTTDLENIEGVNLEYIHTASANIGLMEDSLYTFGFFMPENVQPQGKTPENVALETYVQRNMWTGAKGESAEKKKWTNAPQNSTFVVISGTFEGTALVDGQKQPVSANVEYTIHLGDFGESGDKDRNYGDFSVLRNYSYTYRVKVLGVDNIVVEAHVEGGKEMQPGAEGSVYDRSNTLYSYNLDAHYEQVFLEYNLSAIAKSLEPNLSGEQLDNAIANQLILVIQSEAMSHNADGVVNKRGSLSPYKLYADAVRGKTGIAAQEAAQVAKSAILDGAGEGMQPTKGFDYKWIEFWPQTDTKIAKYPGISSWARENLDGMNNQEYYAGADGTNQGNGDPGRLLDVYDMIVEMGKAIQEIYLGIGNQRNPVFSETKIDVSTNDDDDYVARFTAFVNENYYLRHPLTGAKVNMWSLITNKMPREMIIAMSTETSLDGNSSYSKVHSYFSQLSMQTFYNDRDTGINAFGIETYNETPFFWFGTPSSTAGLFVDDGRENQKTLIGASNTPDWSKYVTQDYNGWTSSVSTKHEEHKLSKEAYAIEASYAACMSRNRDLNGNGKIDENEIRWFLASLNEYIRMGIGTNAISNAARLFLGEKTALKDPVGINSDAEKLTGYPYNEIENGTLFYTSSAADFRVFWTVEKGSYNNENAKWYVRKQIPIRCIRNLPEASLTEQNRDVSSINGVKSDATFVSHPASGGEPIVLEFKDRMVKSLYRARTAGKFNVHNEDNPQNSYYDGIYVAANFLTSRYRLGDIIGYNGTVGSYTNNGSVTNPCASYREGSYTSGWRVPNLIELTAMNAAGLLNSCNSEDPAICCTQFSKQDVRYGFARSKLIYCPGEKGHEGEIDDNFLIRCVRDVDENYDFHTPTGSVAGR